MVDTTTKPGVIAIVGGKLLTVSHGTIENGVLLIENGKISAVGTAASVKVPKGATIVDAKGMTVYPGSSTRKPISASPRSSPTDHNNNDLVEPSEEILPHMHVYDAFHAETEHIPIDALQRHHQRHRRSRGTDTIPGQDSSSSSPAATATQMMVTETSALAMNFGEAPKRGGRGEGAAGGARYPSTRMGEITQLRQALLDAQEYMAHRGRPAASEDGTAAPASRRPRRCRRLEV